MDLSVSRNCWERSGAVVASALACLLSRSTAAVISSAVASGSSRRKAYQSGPGIVSIAATIGVSG
jgi:hypothetical protein